MLKKISEHNIEQYLIKRCKQLHFFCAKFTSPGLDGVPDRIIITPKGVYFIELKRSKQKPRALQKAVMRKMEQSGANVFCCDSIEQVDQLLNTIINT